VGRHDGVPQQPETGGGWRGGRALGCQGRAGCLSHAENARKAKARKDCSFLKKRTKKLLTVKSRSAIASVRLELPAIDKSFLLLFFKKEDLSFLLTNIH
jgi:hypothetical protein